MHGKEEFTDAFFEFRVEVSVDNYGGYAIGL